MTEPDTIFRGGRVITLDARSTVAESVAVRGRRIAAVGDSAALLPAAGPKTRIIELAGRCVVPGFFDAHPHMDREGLKARGGIAITGLRSIAEILSVVRNAANKVKPGQWIVLMPMGDPPHDYIHRPEQLREGRFPDRRDLDAAAPDNPVYIRAVWGWWSLKPFPSVANSMALRLAGITRDTRAPHKVQIVKDSAGELTGIFLEENYAPVLEYTLFKVVPRFDRADRIESVRLGARAYVAAGTTTAYEGHGLTPEIIRAYRDVNERGELPIRVHAPFSLPTASMDDDRSADLLYHYASVASGRGMTDGMLTVEGLNLGAADPEVAKLIGPGYPYEQWAGHFYQALVPERVIRIGIQAARRGLRVNMAVSFAVNLEYVLRAYEAINREVSIKGLRWVIMHVAHATAEQMDRIRALDVIVTLSPNYIYLFADRFGLDRLDHEGIPIRQFLDAGVTVALETDGVPYPMLFAVWEALARWDAVAQCRRGPSGLSRDQVLRLACQYGHRITWNEDQQGSIEPGRIADLAVLAEDPLTCAEERIKDIAVDFTMVDGALVWERPIRPT